MPSTRRLRVIGLLVLLVVLVTLYITSGARQTSGSTFYQKTQDALAQQRAAKEDSLGSRNGAADLDTESDGVARRLKDAEDAAKKAADRKAEEFHGETVVEDKKKKKEALDKQQAKEAAAAAQKAGSPQDPIEAGKESEKTDEETEEEHQVKEELNSILKKSPVIIFSKSYCPYSRKAKDILLNKYDITPAPHVVELDQHPLGNKLQAELGSITGRRTVPNILVNGKSIGGGDDMQALHQDGKLVETIKGLGGKRVDVKVVGKAHED